MLPEGKFYLKHSFETTKRENAISHLMKGYANLNEYLFKCVLKVGSCPNDDNFVQIFFLSFLYSN